MDSSYASRHEKLEVSELENGEHEPVTKKGEIERIDAIATAQGTTLASFAHLDEKKILRKVRGGNIGNAKIEGLQEDLGMTADQYNWCLTVFFFTYAAFEVPSNLLLKKLRPSVWLPTIMVAWGVVMTLMGIVKNYHGLLIARIFLGVTEAGLFPGVAYYLTMWYCRHEIQLRQAMFFSAASIAGAFSGLLAFAISKMDGIGGLEGWRWIFILEGIVTVLVAVMAFFALHDFPETAKFLTEEERAFIVFRLKYQGQVQGKQENRVQVAEAEEFKWKYVVDAFTDWQIWINIFVYWGIVCPLYGISLFLPTIIRNLNYTSSTAQLMTVPIYITAAILAVIVAYISDRVGKRSPFIVGFLCMMIVGFSMWVAYRVFLGGNSPADRFATQAMASNFYRQKDGPRYILGHALELGFISVGIIAALILIFSYIGINKKRDRKMAAGEDSKFTAEELSAQGDRAVTFRYMW
ncbi:hypothetical protein COL5a_008511 [Colletotrichum fioriniae]|nr:hypothetical protein COL5a_008511 [Colletotrichum fioriniae]